MDEIVILYIQENKMPLFFDIGKGTHVVGGLTMANFALEQFSEYFWNELNDPANPYDVTSILLFLVCFSNISYVSFYLGGRCSQLFLDVMDNLLDNVLNLGVEAEEDLFAGPDINI